LGVGIANLLLSQNLHIFVNGLSFSRQWPVMFRL
jgi:hypothetical protein